MSAEKPSTAPTATLNNLAPELKAMIVKNVYDGDSDADDQSEDVKKGVNSAIRALTLVGNREFSALAQAYLWKASRVRISPSP